MQHLPVVGLALSLLLSATCAQYTSPSPKPAAGTAGPNIAQIDSTSVNSAYGPNTSNLLPAWNGFIKAYGTKYADSSCTLYPVNGPNVYVRLP